MDTNLARTSKAYIGDIKKLSPIYSSNSPLSSPKPSPLPSPKTLQETVKNDEKK